MTRTSTLIAIAALALGCAQSTTRTDAGPEVDAGPGVDAGADTDAGTPTSCGGFGGGTCAADEYCDYPYDICGADDGTGECRPRPEGCPENYDPVCACDGNVYGNDCEAQAAGFDVNGNGSCPAEPGRFACGYRFCSTETYCRVVIDDTGRPPAYSCEAFPDPCDGGGRDCTCVASEPCGDLCEMDAAGNVTVTCPGG